MAIQRVGVRELKANASRLLRQVRETGEIIEVTVQGKPIARLVPIPQPPSDAERAAWLVEWDELAERIAPLWPSGDAVRAVRDARREL